MVEAPLRDDHENLRTREFALATIGLCHTLHLHAGDRLRLVAPHVNLPDGDSEIQQRDNLDNETRSRLDGRRLDSW